MGFTLVLTCFLCAIPKVWSYLEALATRWRLPASAGAWTERGPVWLIVIVCWLLVRTESIIVSEEDKRLDVSTVC